MIGVGLHVGEGTHTSAGAASYGRLGISEGALVMPTEDDIAYQPLPRQVWSVPSAIAVASGATAAAALGVEVDEHTLRGSGHTLVEKRRSSVVRRNEAGREAAPAIARV